MNTFKLIQLATWDDLTFEIAFAKQVSLTYLSCVECNSSDTVELGRAFETLKTRCHNSLEKLLTSFMTKKNIISGNTENDEVSSTLQFSSVPRENLPLFMYNEFSKNKTQINQSSKISKYAEYSSSKSISSLHSRENSQSKSSLYQNVDKSVKLQNDYSKNKIFSAEIERIKYENKSDSRYFDTESRNDEHRPSKSRHLNENIDEIKNDSFKTNYSSEKYEGTNDGSQQYKSFRFNSNSKINDFKNWPQSKYTSKDIISKKKMTDDSEYQYSLTSRSHSSPRSSRNSHSRSSNQPKKQYISSSDTSQYDEEERTKYNPKMKPLRKVSHSVCKSNNETQKPLCKASYTTPYDKPSHTIQNSTNFST